MIDPAQRGTVLPSRSPNGSRSILLAQVRFGQMHRSPRRHILQNEKSFNHQELFAFHLPLSSRQHTPRHSATSFSRFERYRNRPTILIRPMPNRLMLLGSGALILKPLRSPLKSIWPPESVLDTGKYPFPISTVSATMAEDC